MCAHVYICTYAHIYMYVCTCVYMYICTYIHVCVYTAAPFKLDPRQAAAPASAELKVAALRAELDVYTHACIRRLGVGCSLKGKELELVGHLVPSRRTYIHVCVYMCIYVHMHIYTCMCVHVYICT